MGSLSNLYISQSYTSLIHLGNDTTITTASVQLQDGLGNGIGVFVNSLGNVFLSGSLTSSLTNGYVWVGDANNRTTLVATSSFGGGSSINTGSFVTTSSFNAYTSSTNSSITQLNASSASQQISINALNGATSSYATSAITASSVVDIFSTLVDNQFTYTKGDGSQQTVTLNSSGTVPAGTVSGSAQIVALGFLQTSSFNSYTASTNSSITQLNASSASQQISINALNSYTASNQPINTGSFATTGSNTFVGPQRISGSNDNHIYINRPGGTDVLRLGVSDNGNTFDFRMTGSVNQDIWLIDNQGGTFGNAFFGFIQAEGRTTINAPFTGSQGAQINGGNLVIQSGSNGLVVHGNKQFNVGAFSSLVTQSGSANVSQSMNFETTDISQGVTIVSNSRITLANSGTYNIQFSAQFDRVTGSGNDTVHVWLKKNGVNYTASAGVLTVSGGANQAKALAAWNYVVESTSSDYWELCWQTSDTNIKLISFPASGNIPLVPSVILTVTQVR